MQSVQMNDILTYRFLSGLQYAPDGHRAAFVVIQADEEENAYASRLYLYDGQVRQLTDMGRERSFTWLDDHRILFPAVRSPKEKKRAEQKEQFTSYYALDVRGGEAMPAFTLPFAAQSIKVVDENCFAVLGSIDAAVPDYYLMTDEARAQVAKNYDAEKDYEVFDEAPFWRNGGGVCNKKRTALFLVTADPLSVRRVTEPLENADSLCVIGDEVFFLSSAYETKPNRMQTVIRALNVQTGEVRDVFRDDALSPGQLMAVGGKLYLLASRCQRHGLNENDWVYTVDPATGELALLHEEEHSMYSSVGSDCRYGGGMQRMAKGDQLYYVSTREGNSLLFRLDKEGQDEIILSRDGSIDSIALSEGSDTVLMVAMLDQKLQELYAYDLNKCRLTQLTHLNDAALKGKYVAKPQPLTVKSQGYDIGGWVLLPRDYDPSKTYPAVLDIHGGPKTAYGPVFVHEMQLWAGMGYFVFFCNPKGSDGRDNEFADIRGHYGETDYQNIMDFTDAVLEKYPQIDRNRICETGGSYGGFMTNWIIGHTDRFCCTASQRSIANWLSFYGVADIGPFFAADQNDADPLTQPERLWEHSPLKYARYAKTPTLFIHSDEDYRCPLAEGLQMYSALVDQGVPTRLCMFHGENHELSRSGKPRHRIRRLTEITDWFEKWTKQN